MTFRGQLRCLEMTDEKRLFSFDLSDFHPKILTFRRKGVYLEITLKKSFLAHISENIKIQGKATSIEISFKNRFLSISLKYQHF